MVTLDKLVKKLQAKHSDIDPALVAQVCKYPFEFLKEVMADDEDIYDINFYLLGKFSLKAKRAYAWKQPRGKRCRYNSIDWSNFKKQYETV